MTVGNTTGLFTKNTDYKISTTNGSINFFNTDVVNMTTSNNTVVYYTQCPDGYVYGWAATMLKLVYGFFALSAMGIAIGLFYSIGKDYGIV